MYADMAVECEQFFWDCDNDNEDSAPAYMSADALTKALHKGKYAHLSKEDFAQVVEQWAAANGFRTPSRNTVRKRLQYVYNRRKAFMK
jgi:hypothetical protein